MSSTRPRLRRARPDMWLLNLAARSSRNRLERRVPRCRPSRSACALLGAQIVRTAARDSFENTLSGTDLIVGARTGSIDLLLLSVFRIGNADANVSWKTYQKIAHHPDVAWTIPISLGDMHRGFRVIGTNSDYFAHYRFNAGRSPRFRHRSPVRRSVRCRAPAPRSHASCTTGPGDLSRLSWHGSRELRGSRRQALPHRWRTRDDGYAG